MSTVIADNLTGKTAANDVTVTVGATATASLQSSLAKAWVNFNGTGTVAIRDSFNQSSLVDNGTGIHTIGFANNMNNDNYSGVSGGHVNITTSRHTHNTFVTLFTTSTFTITCNNSSLTAGDLALTTAIVNGDLA